MVIDALKKIGHGCGKFFCGPYRVCLLLGFALLAHVIHILILPFPRRDALTYLHILHYWNSVGSFGMVLEKFPKFGLLIFTFLPLKWADKAGIPLFPASIVWMTLMSLISVCVFYRIVLLLTGSVGKAMWCGVLLAVHPSIMFASGSLLRDTPYLMFVLLHALCFIELLRHRSRRLMLLSGVTLAMCLLSRFEAWELLLLSPVFALFYARKQKFSQRDTLLWILWAAVGFIVTLLIMLSAVNDLASLAEKGKIMLISFFPDWMKFQ